MDFLESEDEPGFQDYRARYRLCRAGFGLIGFGLALLGLDSACWLLIFLTHSSTLWNLVHEPWWPWAIGAPITWATLIGSYLLWGRWSDPRWQRPAGLLVMFNMIHLALWALDQSGELGLRPDKVGHEWFRHQLAEVLNWVEYALIAGLAVDVLEHLGASAPSSSAGKGPVQSEPQPEVPEQLETSDVREAGRRARAFTIAGLTVWAVAFLDMTDWGRGWPLMGRGANRPEFLLLWLLSLLLTAAVVVQLVALCLWAWNQCSTLLQELNQASQADDLLRSRSESFSDDDNPYKPPRDFPL